MESTVRLSRKRDGVSKVVEIERPTETYAQRCRQTEKKLVGRKTKIGVNKDSDEKEI